MNILCSLAVSCACWVCPFGGADWEIQVLKSKAAVVNRAPVMTAWATVVAERMGFKREEALSIGSSECTFLRGCQV